MGGGREAGYSSPRAAPANSSSADWVPPVELVGEVVVMDVSSGAVFSVVARPDSAGPPAQAVAMTDRAAARTKTRLRRMGAPRVPSWQLPTRPTCSAMAAGLSGSRR